MELPSIHVAVPLSSVLQVLLIILFIYLFFSSGNICTCDTEENCTIACIKENPYLCQGNPHDVITVNPLVQVVVQGSLFSQTSWISLNPDICHRFLRLG